MLDIGVQQIKKQLRRGHCHVVLIKGTQNYGSVGAVLVGCIYRVLTEKMLKSGPRKLDIVHYKYTAPTGHFFKQETPTSVNELVKFFLCLKAVNFTENIQCCMKSRAGIFLLLRILGRKFLLQCLQYLCAWYLI